MDILSEIYNKSLTENERNLHFWESYLQNLQQLDFGVYSDKLKVPILVPIGSRILFRGELKHTNEVTVALGADYFVKCSLAQANILKNHRIKVAQENVDTYKKEQQYLQNQMSFSKQHVYENEGQEIIEYHTVEEDKAWREKHHANVKAYFQNRKKEENKCSEENVTDEELWERLEELELQEELENELNDLNTDSLTTQSVNIKLDNTKENDFTKKDETKAIKEIQNMKALKDTKIPEQSSKLDLLQQVINRQNELDERLQELKNRKRSQSKTEMDILTKLDELEQLDELEDEMDRLDDIIENEDSEEEIFTEPSTEKFIRRVSFVDQDDSETLHLTFKHSDVEPNNDSYDPDKGILKPSDIYKAYSNLFENGTTSILKKSKYATDYDVPEPIKKSEIKFGKEESELSEQSEKQDQILNRQIVIKDVIENMEHNNNTLQTETKPMSLFKKKRMQNKN